MCIFLEENITFIFFRIFHWKQVLMAKLKAIAFSNEYWQKFQGRWYFSDKFLKSFGGNKIILQVAV